VVFSFAPLALLTFVTSCGGHLSGKGGEDASNPIFYDAPDPDDASQRETPAPGPMMSIPPMQIPSMPQLDASTVGSTDASSPMDPHNCGRSGHDCQGGKCLNGACQPLELAPGLAHWLAVDATSVYWLSTDAVMKVAIGGGKPTTLVSGQPDPQGIAVDATSVYWTTMDTDGKVMKAPLAGGEPTTLASAQQFERSIARGIALDATDIYWTNRDSVTKLPLGGGAPVLLGQVARGQAWGIAVDSMNVYLTAFGSGGVVQSLPIEGGAVTTLASGQGFPYAITVDATNVYWTDISAVMKVARVGGAPMMIASPGMPSSIATDGLHVYFTGRYDGVTMMGLDGSMPTVLAKQIGFSIAVDATSVYWVVEYGGVMKIAKP
jgi:hypothetical protein